MVEAFISHYGGYGPNREERPRQLVARTHTLFRWVGPDRTIICSFADLSGPVLSDDEGVSNSRREGLDVVWTQVFGSVWASFV